MILLLLLLTACSSKTYNKPGDVSQQVWDEGLQYAIMIDSNQSHIADIATIGSNIRDLEKISETEQEKELIDNLRMMFYGKVDVQTGNEKQRKEGTKTYKEARKVVAGYFGNDALNGDNLQQEKLKNINDETNAIQESIDNYSPVNEYMENENIHLAAKDVQFDMANNIDKDFVVAGVAELSDYYNYGFDSDMEATYFCARVIPEDGSYSDGWYLYFHRESYQELFEKLKNGNANVIMTANIPSNRYKDRQGNMALAQKVKY